MQRKQKIRLGFAPIALAAIIAPMALTNCSTLDAVCCKDFQPGTNMVAVDWGLDAKANAEFGASIQAIGDFSATATGMVNDLGVACKGLAIDLGADENSVKTDVTDPQEIATQWCGIAADLTTKLRASATLKIDIQEPRCEVNVSAKLDCQAQCSASAKCELSPGEIKASCEPGKLSGQCSAQCTGSCEGSASVAVSCKGTCSGECDGTCDGTASSGQCSGACDGKCRGSCAVEASDNISCEGTCSGDCTAEFKAPKCEGKFTPPSGKCEASANCSGSCDASASAKAECTPPSISISLAAGASADVQAKVAALQKWLPQIFLIIKGRFNVLTGQIEGLGTVAANLTGSVSAGGKAAFCIIPAAEAVVVAGENIGASGSVTASFVGAVGG